MEVIWHNGISIQLHEVKSLWQGFPYLLQHLPCIVKAHILSDDLTEQGSFAVDANRYEVCAGSGIVVSAKAD